MTFYLLLAQSGPDASDIGRALGGAISAIVFLLLYLLPTFIAGMRHHKNTAAICVLNILLGWTCIGWVVALVWSFTVDDGPTLRTEKRFIRK